MRRGETDTKNYFRSEARIFNLNGSWYFATREGDQGPFFERDVAEREAARYASDRVTLGRFQASREAEHMAQRRAVKDLSILPKEESAPTRYTLTLEPH